MLELQGFSFDGSAVNAGGEIRRAAKAWRRTFRSDSIGTEAVVRDAAAFVLTVATSLVQARRRNALRSCTEARVLGNFADCQRRELVGQVLRTALGERASQLPQRQVQGVQRWDRRAATAV